MSAVEQQPAGRFGLRQEKRLGELLLEHGLLTAEQLETALAEQRRQRRPLGQVLLAQGMVDEKALAGVLSLHFNVPQIDFSRARKRWDDRLITEHFCCETQVQFKNLAQVHTRRNAERCKNDVDRITVFIERHILFRQDA